MFVPACQMCVISISVVPFIMWLPKIYGKNTYPCNHISFVGMWMHACMKISDITMAPTISHLQWTIKFDKSMQCMSCNDGALRRSDMMVLYSLRRHWWCKKFLVNVLLRAIVLFQPDQHMFIGMLYALHLQFPLLSSCAWLRCPRRDQEGPQGRQILRLSLQWLVQPNSITMQQCILLKQDT